MNLVPTMGAMMLADPGLPQPQPRVLARDRLRRRHVPRPCGSASPLVFARESTNTTDAGNRGAHRQHARRPEGASGIDRPALCFAEVQNLARRRQPRRAGRSRRDRRPLAGDRHRLFRQPAESAETFRDGWFRTGDLGAMDEEGFMFIKGRLKDMIITGGQNVHAAEVEEVLIGLPGRRRLRGVRLPDESLGRAGRPRLSSGRPAGVRTVTEETLRRRLPRPACRVQDAEDDPVPGRAPSSHADRQGAEVSAGRALRVTSAPPLTAHRFSPRPARPTSRRVKN